MLKDKETTLASSSRNDDIKNKLQNIITLGSFHRKKVAGIRALVY